MQKAQELITLQKFIYLLGGDHYTEFISFLAVQNARLPLLVSETIHKTLPYFDTNDQLCHKIYGGFEKKQRQSFNQLCSYTFKLSANLASNYPAYLSRNQDRLQKLVNEGKMEQANFLADCLADVAERIEDFQSLTFALKFKMQQAFLYKDLALAFKLDSKIDSIYEAEQLRHRLLTTIRKTLNISLSGHLPADELVEHQKRFLSLENHEYLSIRLLSQYGYLYSLYYFEPDKFNTEEISRRIAALEKELNNYGHLVFSFMFDLKSNISFLKLNSTSFDLTATESKKSLNELLEHYKQVKFWQNYLPAPMLFAITAKTSFYLSAYHYHLHRNDYKNCVPDRDMRDIEELCKTCSDILANKDWETHYKNDLINLRLVYASLLMLKGGSFIKDGATELESMLITYQQLNISGTIDSIFICLMIAYFSTKQYDKCVETFKRYLKIIRGKPVYEDNDMGIHTYYYLGQWLRFQRRQYLQKLEDNYQKSLSKNIYSEPRKAMEELIRYFELPIAIV